MAKIMRKRPCIVAIVGELIAGRMAKHVWVNLERELRSASSSLDHSQEPSWRYRSASLSHEHIRASALEWPQRSQLWPM
jgi:hypothetical protein